MKNSKIFFLLSIIAILIISCSQSQPSAGTSSSEPEKAKTTAPSSQQSGQQVSVSIKNFKFAPQDIVVKAGTTVVWTNEDSAPHTVESSDGALKSDELSKGDTYSWTAKASGKHEYHCGIHPSMKGTVTVQ